MDELAELKVIDAASVPNHTHTLAASHRQHRLRWAGGSVARVN